MNTLSLGVIIAVMIVFIVYVGFKLYGSIKLKGLRQTAIDLICEAEKTYEKGKNDEKFQLVLDGILGSLPAPAKLILNKSTVEFFIQSVFDSVKIALDTETENKSEG